MNKFLRVLLLASIVLLIPFGYLYVRDFVYAEESTEVLTDCTPYNLSVDKDRFEVSVSWQTTDRCPGFIKYDVSSKNKDGQTVTGKDEFLPVTDHTVVIKDLKPATTYYLWIYSDDTAFGENGLPISVRL